MYNVSVREEIASFGMNLAIISSSPGRCSSSGSTFCS